MDIPLEIIGIYIGMVIFGLIAYAYIIPYFVVRRIKKIVESGWAAQQIGILLPQLLALRVKSVDNQGQEREQALVNYLVSVAMHNLKLQLSGMKGAMVKSMMSNAELTPESLTAMEAMLEAVPKKWRWAAQLGLMLAGPRLAAAQQQGQPPQEQVKPPSAAEAYMRGTHG